MPNFMWKNNKILFSDNKIAMSEDCCCHDNVVCCSGGPAATAKISVSGFLDYGTIDYFVTAPPTNPCLGSLACTSISSHSAINGSYTATSVSKTGNRIAATCIIGTGTSYANAGKLVYKELIYGGAAGCGNLLLTREYYLVEVNAAVNCIFDDPCGRRIDGIGIRTQRWQLNAFIPPFTWQGPVSSVPTFGAGFPLDAPLNLGKLFIPSTTTNTADLSGLTVTDCGGINHALANDVTVTMEVG